MAGEPAHFEIGVPDGARAQAFYSKVLEWTFHPMQGDQAWIETPGARGGLHDGDPAANIEVYFAVPDIEAAVERVRTAGGEASDPSDEGEFGRFSRCLDDQGVRFGLHQARGS
jgi:uncharacterized protein